MPTHNKRDACTIEYLDAIPPEGATPETIAAAVGVSVERARKSLRTLSGMGIIIEAGDVFSLREDD